MPISSHCFWPCARLPASRLRIGAKPDGVENVGDAPHFIVGFMPPQRGAGRAVVLERKQQIVLDGVHLEHRRLLELAADAERGDLRFRRAWSGRELPSKNTSPSSGRVLPVTMSIIVVLPAPFGPMMARISPGSTASDRLLMARKPSNDTLTPLR